jgi:hypothetical protein
MSSTIAEFFAQQFRAVWADQKGIVAPEPLAAPVTTLGCFECGVHAVVEFCCDVMEVGIAVCPESET